MVVAMLSNQVGNSFAKRLTDAMATPLGAVFMRLAFAGAILLLIALVRFVLRRLGLLASTKSEVPPWQKPREAWLYAIAFGMVLVAMNSLFYEALERLPVGIVITIEFLGPLAVALLGSRRAIDFVWVGLAGIGVALLGITPTPLPLAGVLFAGGAAVCWAGYILLGARVTRHWTGGGVLTGACIAGSLVMTPAFLMGGNIGRLSWPTIGLAAVVALTCSVLPYSMELFALRRISTRLFGILESLAPAIGALAAWLVLSQRLHFGDWIAIACVVVASIGATLARSRRQSVH